MGGSNSDQRYATESILPSFAKPIENQRSSIALCSRSATVSSLGSAKIVDASSNEMPCLSTFAAALISSHSN